HGNSEPQRRFPRERRKFARWLHGRLGDRPIYRLMIAQRIRHSRQAEILDDSSTAVAHTPELISRLFDEELDRLLQEQKSDDPQTAATLREARRISEEMIRREEFDPR